MRYDELTIKWALRQFIRLGASKYNELRDIFYLPGDRYLRDFKNVFDVKDGIQHDVLEAMKEKIDREGQKGPLLLLRDSRRDEMPSRSCNRRLMAGSSGGALSS